MLRHGRTEIGMQIVHAKNGKLFRAWQEYVATLVGRLSVEGRLRLRDHMLTRARAVARAHGGVVGLRAVADSVGGHRLHRHRRRPRSAVCSAPS